MEIRNHGFRGEDEAQIRQAIDSAEGFALMLAGAKAWPEHGLRLGLVADRHPDMLVRGWLQA